MSTHSLADSSTYVPAHVVIPDLESISIILEQTEVRSVGGPSRKIGHSEGFQMPGNGICQPRVFPCKVEFLQNSGCASIMPGWFKGMEQILRERDLFCPGLLTQCTGFKCVKGATNCCCRRTLFCQPDFSNQKSALQELIERRGHICDFYPKYHCKLNFIEMYRGAAKFQYRKSPRTSNITEMEANIKRSLPQE